MAIFAELAKVALEVLKLAPRYLVALAVVFAVFLFAGEVVLKFLGVFEFAQNYRSQLGVAFVVASVLLGVTVVAEVFALVKSGWANWRAKRRVIKRMQRLTEDEKQILRFYIDEKTLANRLCVNDRVVQGLVADKILLWLSRRWPNDGTLVYHISGFAWDYLYTHSHLLDAAGESKGSDGG